MSPAPSDRYKYCNHHHELNEDYAVVDFGHGPFVANKQAIPLLEALHNLGLRTRTHHIDDQPHAWFSILIDDHVSLEIKNVHEHDAERTTYNGMRELLITWKRTTK